jgi:hypothetical protein
MEVKALAPSRAWLQGAAALLIWGRSAHLSCNPTNCWPISDRSHNHNCTTPTKETR